MIEFRKIEDLPNYVRDRMDNLKAGDNNPEYDSVIIGSRKDGEYFIYAEKEKLSVFKDIIKETFAIHLDCKDITSDFKHLPTRTIYMADFVMLDNKVEKNRFGKIEINMFI